MRGRKWAGFENLRYLEFWVEGNQVPSWQASNDWNSLKAYGLLYARKNLLF